MIFQAPNRVAQGQRWKAGVRCVGVCRQKLCRQLTIAPIPLIIQLSLFFLSEAVTWVSQNEQKLSSEWDLENYFKIVIYLLTENSRQPNDFISILIEMLTLYPIQRNNFQKFLVNECDVNNSVGLNQKTRTRRPEKCLNNPLGYGFQERGEAFHSLSIYMILVTLFMKVWHCN